MNETEYKEHKYAIEDLFRNHEVGIYWKKEDGKWSIKMPLYDTHHLRASWPTLPSRRSVFTKSKPYEHATTVDATDEANLPPITSWAQAPTLKNNLLARTLLWRDKKKQAVIERQVL